MGGWAGPRPGAAQGGETTKVEIWSEFERLNLVPRYELVAGSVSKGGVPRLILSESTRTQTIEPYCHYTLLFWRQQSGQSALLSARDTQELPALAAGKTPSSTSKLSSQYKTRLDKGPERGSSEAPPRETAI